MAPPSYSDLGKSAKDLFAKGYHYGLFKLELKTKAKNGIEVTAGGNHNFDSGKVTGNLETKYKVSDIGLTFVEKWHTDNIITSEVTIEDQLLPGLKLAFDCSFAPQTGKKSGKVKGGYKNDYVNLGCDVDFDFAGPLIHGSGVIGYKGYLAGHQLSFDTAKSKLVKNNFALGYQTNEFALHTNVNDGSEFAASIYQKINDDLEAGVSLSWSTVSNATRFAIGGKYLVDSESSISGKVNNSGQVGFGYTTCIRDGVKVTLSTDHPARLQAAKLDHKLLYFAHSDGNIGTTINRVKVTLSTLLDCKQLNQGGHKLGFCIDLAA